jgi:hypothetical protein
MLMGHMNGLIAREQYFERLALLLGPEDFERLIRRQRRRRDRAEKRARRHAAFPYASTRQNARYARQIAAGQLRFA